jgi:hypothetical protein
MVAAFDDGREWLLVDPLDGGRWLGLGVGRNGGRLFRWGRLGGRCDGIGGRRWLELCCGRCGIVGRNGRECVDRGRGG